MSYIIPGGLPSLAHPLIVSAAQDVENDTSSLHLPPFPWINLRWSGFTIPHLRWVGIKVTEREIPNLESSWPVKLAWYHEYYHQRELARPPFSRIRDHETFMLHGLIFETFEKEREQIPVPLSHDLSRNELEKQWNTIVRLNRASCLIEEVYAVRSSLLKVWEEGLITPSLQGYLIIKYKQQYEEFIPGYAAVYNLCDFVARRIGETGVNALIQHALGTIHPERAFLKILFYLCNIDVCVPIKDFLERLSDEMFGWILSEKETNSIKTFSFIDAYNYFDSLMDDLDPGDAHYRRKDVLDHAEMLVNHEHVLFKYIKDDDVIKFILNSPTSILLSGYINCIDLFYKLDVTGIEEVKDGNFIIFLEAIMQQLTRGRGLLCPFWLKLPDNTCCGGRNREFLEKVWKCTKPDRSSCRFWKRLGCLQTSDVKS
jgi:hypothetical protein